MWRKLLANFTHLMALLLWAGGAMAFVGKMPQLGWAIWAVVVINAIFSFWQEFRAEKAADALKKLLPQFARVLRDGNEAKVPANELVPGDVIVLSEGDHISADARLVEEAEMRVDLSTLNGESAPARRTAEASLRDGLTVMERPNSESILPCVLPRTTESPRRAISVSRQNWRSTIRCRAAASACGQWIPTRGASSPMPTCSSAAGLPEQVAP